MRYLFLAAILFSSALKPAELPGPLEIRVDVHPNIKGEFEFLSRGESVVASQVTTISLIHERTGNIPLR